MLRSMVGNTLGFKESLRFELAKASKSFTCRKEDLTPVECRFMPVGHLKVSLYLMGASVFFRVSSRLSKVGLDCGYRKCVMIASQLVYLGS